MSILDRGSGVFRDRHQNLKQDQLAFPFLLHAPPTLEPGEACDSYWQLFVCKLNPHGLTEHCACAGFAPYLRRRPL